MYTKFVEFSLVISIFFQLLMSKSKILLVKICVVKDIQRIHKKRNKFVYSLQLMDTQAIVQRNQFCNQYTV